MKRIHLALFFTSLLYANEIEILTPEKQEISNLKQKQIEQKEKVNKYNWLSNITLNGSQSKDNNDVKSEDYSISISQDIFRFGGIYSQIEYSKTLKTYEELALEISNKEDISTTYSLLINIKLNELALKKNILNLKNKLIDINHKKSEYKAGQLGISDLNEAIMEKNALKETQKTLELTKQKNLNTLKQYTNKTFNTIKIPTLKLIDKKLFLEKANRIKVASLNTKINELTYKIKRSDYLPKLSITGKYGHKNSDLIEGNNYHNYGLNISMPLSFTSANNIAQSKIEYLISKQELAKQKNDVELFYNEILLSLNNYQEKIDLALEDIKLYNELLLINKEEYDAGYKTIDDVESLQNSKIIRELDISDYRLNIKNLLIKLYEKVL